MRPVALLLIALCVARAPAGDVAVLADGSRLAGRLDLGKTGRLVFVPDQRGGEVGRGFGPAVHRSRRLVGERLATGKRLFVIEHHSRFPVRGGGGFRFNCGPIVAGRSQLRMRIEFD